MDRVDGTMYRLADRNVIFGALDQLSEDQTITAWVASNDNVALDCYDYIKVKHRTNTGRPVIIGFDDSEIAFIHQFTSYNFNVPARLTAMLRFIIEERSQFTKSILIRTIPGFISQRATTPAIGHPTL